MFLYGFCSLKLPDVSPGSAAPRHHYIKNSISSQATLLLFLMFGLGLVFPGLCLVLCIICWRACIHEVRIQVQIQDQVSGNVRFISI